MPATISIRCPSCKKNMTGPAAALGKKVKCKACNHVFVAMVEGAAAEPARGDAKKGGATNDSKGKAPAAKPKQEVDKNRLLDPNDSDPGKSYGFEEQKQDEIARCPQCAYELETVDAVVCLTCGYNLLTRKRLQMQKIYERNFMDWVVWYTPTTFAILGCLASLAFGIFLWTGLKWWYGDWWFSHFSVQVWFTVFAAGGAWSCGKYAFKRIYYQPKPPEKLKRQ